MFSQKDVRRMSRKETNPNHGNSAIDESLMNGNYGLRRAIAQTEIWMNDGSLSQRGADCTSCCRTNDCPGDKCLRMN